MNHIIVIYNKFGQEAGTRLLFLKLDGYHGEIIPFLKYLNRCPDVVPKIGLPVNDIVTFNIKQNQKVAEILQQELG